MNDKQKLIVESLVNSIKALSDNENVYDDKNNRAFSFNEIKLAFPEVYGVVMDDNYTEVVCFECGSDEVEYHTAALAWDAVKQTFVVCSDYHVDTRCCNELHLGWTNAGFIRTKKDTDTGLYYAKFANPDGNPYAPEIPHHRLPSREAAIRFVRNYLGERLNAKGKAA